MYNESIPIDDKMVSTNSIAAMMDTISALYDVKWRAGPSTLDPDEKITLPLRLSAKQKPCAAFPLSTEASVAIANFFAVANFSIWYSDLGFNVDFPHMCLFHRGDHWIAFWIRCSATANLGDVGAISFGFK